MNVKNIYMAGSGGMLGEAFYKIFSEDYELRCTDINVNEQWLTYLDFRDFESCRMYEVGTFYSEIIEYLSI